jgi:hypothetical protein
MVLCVSYEFSRACHVVSVLSIRFSSNMYVNGDRHTGSMQSGISISGVPTLGKFIDMFSRILNVIYE